MTAIIVTLAILTWWGLGIWAHAHRQRGFRNVYVKDLPEIITLGLCSGPLGWLVVWIEHNEWKTVLPRKKD